MPNVAAGCSISSEEIDKVAAHVSQNDFVSYDSQTTILSITYDTVVPRHTAHAAHGVYDRTDTLNGNRSHQQLATRYPVSYHGALAFDWNFATT